MGTERIATVLKGYLEPPSLAGLPRLRQPSPGGAILASDRLLLARTIASARVSGEAGKLFHQWGLRHKRTSGTDEARAPGRPIEHGSHPLGLPG